MRMRKSFVLIATACLLFVVTPAVAQTPVIKDYGDLNLSGLYQIEGLGAVPGGQPADQWDLTQCDLVLSFTLDMTSMTPPAMDTTAWTSVGLRGPAWGWIAAGGPKAFLDTENDVDYTGDGIPDPMLDLDDKLNLLASDPDGTQRWDELSYDATSPDTILPEPFGSYDSYGIWFDRDGICPCHANAWGSVDGGNYNTMGMYQVEVLYHAIGPDQGTMFARVNDLGTGFYTDWEDLFFPLIMFNRPLVPLPTSNQPQMASHIPPKYHSDAPPEYYPAGKSFTGDLTQVEAYAWWSAPDASYGNVQLTDVMVMGCLATSD
jgi:hypothetical protein